MSKSHRRTNSPPRPSSVAAVRQSDWIIAGLAALGLLLTFYLLFASRDSGLPGCPTGGGCDLVQRSRWSTFFGLPLAGFGAVLYAGIMASALYIRATQRRLLIVLILGVSGFGISAYLALVILRELSVTCPYCMVSLALIGTLAAYAGYQLRARERWWGAALGLLLAAGIASLMHLQHAGTDSVFSGAEDPYLKKLASHLKDNNAKFFGAFWCPHCQQQKALFGAAAKYLPYIECSPHGAGTPQATDCLAHGIESYPTWIIADKQYPKLLTIEYLARVSGFRESP